MRIGVMKRPTPGQLSTLSDDLREQKLRLANDILANLNKAEKLQNLMPGDLADKYFFYELELMDQVDYDHRIFNQ